MAALRQQVNAFVSAALAPAARAQRLAALAKQMRAELISSGRASPVSRTFVDGREGAPEESVRGTGGGSIVYVFSYAAEAAVFALGFLRSRAPARRGIFRESFWVSVDGRYLAPGRFDPRQVPPSAEITIGNTQPYNRLVDVQVAGGKRLRFSVPAGLYDDAARAVQRQFRGAITARRIYSISFPGQYDLKSKGRRAGNRKGKVQSPALVISPTR